MAQKIVTPKDERELSVATVEDVIKISIYNAHFPKGFQRIWALYDGFSNGNDHFIAPGYDPQTPADARLVYEYISPRRTHQFDNNLGVILSSFHYTITPIGNQIEGYTEKVKRLREANLWSVEATV